MTAVHAIGHADSYVCPMHPDVAHAKPGRCPKCGMALVAAADMKSGAAMHHTAEEPVTWRSYLPLIVIFLLLLAATAVLSWRAFSWHEAVANFMTGFFLVFAGFKLMDLKGFAEGYSTYDLLARRWLGYGYLYPFIELGFGLAMLARIGGAPLLWAEIIVMVFSGVGVALKLAKGEQFQCSCLGTVLKVPLTKVTLIEDFGMAALAAMLLLLP